MTNWTVLCGEGSDIVKDFEHITFFAVLSKAKNECTIVYNYITTNVQK